MSDGEIERGGALPDSGEAQPVASTPMIDLEDVPERQQMAAERFAAEFLMRVVRLKGVRIDREHFLRSELHRRGVGTTTIEHAIRESPAAAGVSLTMLDQIASRAVEFETRKSTAVSFASGLPGGFALIGTVPADLSQFYVHAFRIMQKVAYVYGWKDFLSDTDDVDDETLGKLTAFLGVMMGVSGASTAVTSFAANVARPAVQKQIAGIALTKTTWYTPMKQVLRVVGVKVTKDGFAKVVSKSVPVVGGVVSGGLTYAALRVQSRRLIAHLRQLPPPNVDAEEHLRLLRALEDPEATERSGRAAVAVQGAGSAIKRAATSAAGRTSALVSRRTTRKQVEESEDS